VAFDVNRPPGMEPLTPVPGSSSPTSSGGPTSDRQRHIGIAIFSSIAGFWVVVAALTTSADDWGPLPLFAGLAAFNIAAELICIRRERKDEHDWIQTSTAPLVLAITLLGPAPALLIALLGLVLPELKRRPAVEVWASNLANMSTYIVTSSLLFQWLAVETLGLTPAEPAFAIAVVAVHLYTAGMSFTINAIAGTVFWGESMRQHAQSMQWTFVGDTFFAPLTGVTAYIYGTVGIGALGLLALFQLAHQYLLGNLLISQDRADALVEQAERLSEVSASRGRLVGQVLQAEEVERRRLAEALHDEALQNLLAAKRGLAEPANGGIAHARAGVEQTIEQLRGAIFNLHPGVLEHAGLAAALRAIARRQAERSGFEAEVDVDAETGPHARLLFVLAREQLNNVVKHSGATKVAIVVSSSDGSVVMDVSDNGRGMKPGEREKAVQEGHIGLASSTERVEAVGGQMEVRSAPGEGTLVRTTIPLPAGGSNGLGEDAAPHRLGDRA